MGGRPSPSRGVQGWVWQASCKLAALPPRPPLPAVNKVEWMLAIRALDVLSGTIGEPRACAFGLAPRHALRSLLLPPLAPRLG